MSLLYYTNNLYIARYIEQRRIAQDTNQESSIIRVSASPASNRSSSGEASIGSIDTRRSSVSSIQHGGRVILLVDHLNSWSINLFNSLLQIRQTFY